MKLCIIDDNTSITNMFAKLAKIKGHECTVANDGRTGLSLLENGTFDAVVLDLAMPNFSGIDIVNTLVKNEQIDKKNIVVLTASNVSEKELEDLKKHGVKAVLKKPVKMHALLDVLNNLNG